MTSVLVRVPLSVAESLARDLVVDRLAASVNRISCTSAYRWEDEVRYEDEEILVVQTTADRYDDVVEYVTDRHPYDVPSIERYDETDATPEFLAWRDRCVSASAGSEEPAGE